MAGLFDSMDFVRRRLERADSVEDPRALRGLPRDERIRRERVVARMKNDPAFAEFTAEAQEKLIKAALTDNWDSVLPRLPRIGPE